MVSGQFCPAAGAAGSQEYALAIDLAGEPAAAGAILGVDPYGGAVLGKFHELIPGRGAPAAAPVGGCGVVSSLHDSFIILLTIRIVLVVLGQGLPSTIAQRVVGPGITL